jgi:hypothetical protein
VKVKTMPTINEMIDFCEDMAAYDCFSNEQFARRDMFYAIADELKKKRKYVKWVISEVRCPNCLEYFDTGCYTEEELNRCPNCGEAMR